MLSLLKLHLGSEARTETSAARRGLELAEALPLVDLALRPLRRLREVCGELSPSELSAFGLGPALVALGAAAASAGGIVVKAHELGQPRPDQQGLRGLRGMRERMELLGGMLIVESQRGEGSVVLARVPCAANAAA